MSIPHNENHLGQPLRNKKKRGAVFIVIVVSVAVHALGLGALGVMKIVETISTPPEFEAPPVVAIERPPPPPPPPPTTKRTQRSLPRPQPLAAVNPQNMAVPAIAMADADLSLAGGRGFGGGLGELGGGAMDSLRLTSFGFDRAMEGTLEGTLYDLKRSSRGSQSYKGNSAADSVSYGAGIINSFARNFRISRLDSNFMKSETKLYSAFFVIPITKASEAPRAFKVEGVMKPSLLCANYTGVYKPQESGRFRLVGKADDVLIVRINGKTVLDASWSHSGNYSDWNQTSTAERATKESTERYFGLTQTAIYGDWFELREGAETKVEVVLAEIPGGHFGAYLLIEKEGTSGKKIFTTRPLSGPDKDFLRKLHRDAAKFLP